MENPFQYLIDEHQHHLKHAHLKRSQSQLERSRLQSGCQEKMMYSSPSTSEAVSSLPLPVHRYNTAHHHRSNHQQVPVDPFFSEKLSNLSGNRRVSVG